MESIFHNDCSIGVGINKKRAAFSENVSEQSPFT
jgi:hypothetical protein